MIGSLFYLTTSRPDIIFAFCLCARFQSCPKEFHLMAIKHIFRYLKGTLNYDFWYCKSHDFALIDFLDADFVGCRIDRKSTSGTCHFLGKCLVFGSTKS